MVHNHEWSVSDRSNYGGDLVTMSEEEIDAFFAMNEDAYNSGEPTDEQYEAAERAQERAEDYEREVFYRGEDRETGFVQNHNEEWPDYVDGPEAEHRDWVMSQWDGEDYVDDSNPNAYYADPEDEDDYYTDNVGRGNGLLHKVFGNKRSPDLVKIHGGGALGWLLDWPSKSVAWMSEALLMRTAEYDFKPEDDEKKDRNKSFFDEWRQRKENGATSDLLMQLSQTFNVLSITQGFGIEFIAKQAWENPRLGAAVHVIFSANDLLMHNFKIWCAQNPVWIDGEMNSRVTGSAKQDLLKSIYAIFENNYS